MRDVLPTMESWIAENKRFALARVVSTWGSAPRRAGAAMVISSEGQVAGSVSGGCIEGEVVRTALEVLQQGRPALRSFGVSSEAAWAVGLSCGGQLEVLVQDFDSAGEGEWLSGLRGSQPFLVRTNVETGRSEVSPGATVSAPALEAGWFVHPIAPPTRLLIIGGADIAVHLTAMARRADFHCTVVDPRSVFSDPGRFDVQPDELLNAWPQEVLPDYDADESTFAVLLTHDPKIDDPALHALLNSPAPYIGALGGRKTQKARRERMRSHGYSSDQISRIHGPIGLNIGAATPVEIAASILAEMIAVRNGAISRD